MMPQKVADGQKLWLMPHMSNLPATPKKYTGNFEIDETFLRSKGYTDFEKYDCVKGADLFPDFFTAEAAKIYEDNAAADSNTGTLKAEHFSSGIKTAGSSSPASDLDVVIQKMADVITADGNALCGKINAKYNFNMKDTKKQFHLNLKDAPGASGEGHLPEHDVLFTMKEKDFIKMGKGKLNSTTAFMTGKLKMKGDMGKAMALER